MRTFDELAADPETAALLGFEPVVRKVQVEGGWTAELQREFIARLAAHGSATKACDEMGKNRTGVSRLYRSPAAASFRSAWHAAVELATRRRAEQAPRPEYVSSNAKPPTLDHRRNFGGQQAAPVDSEDGQPDPIDPEEEEMSEDGKLEIFGRLIRKFMAKIAQERSARIGGRVVEADFYLRQITCLEISFDLLTERAGKDAWEVIAQCRRDGHGILQIGDTPMSRILDNARREQWARMGEPQRPEHPPERFLVDHGDHRTEAPECLGPASPPLPGHDPDEWAAMSYDEQKAAQDEQHKRDAKLQIEWEARAAAEAAEWRAAHNDNSAPGSPGEGDQP